MRRKINFKSLALCVAIPLAVGALSALITMGSMKDFAALKQPPASPPGWLFPIVWTALYITMGVASYLVLRSNCAEEEKRGAFKVYFVQLAFNFFWSIIFFSFGAFEIAFAWLLALFALIALTAFRFWRINNISGILMLPYLVWVLFAGYLNLGVAYLN